MVAGAGIYATFFLFIGTLKGLGDLSSSWSQVFVVRTVWPRENKREGKQATIAVTLIGGMAFVGYMAYDQSQRLQQVWGFESVPGQSGRCIRRRRRAGTGARRVAYYPTHGYVGLAYNLKRRSVDCGPWVASRPQQLLDPVPGWRRCKPDPAYPVRTEPGPDGRRTVLEHDLSLARK